MRRREPRPRRPPPHRWPPPRRRAPPPPRAAPEAARALVPREREGERERERERERGGGGIGLFEQHKTGGAERRGQSDAWGGGERLRVWQGKVGGSGAERRRLTSPTRPYSAFCPRVASHHLPTVRFSRFGFFFPLHCLPPPPSYPFSVLAPLAVAIIFPCRFHARHWLWIRLGLEAAAGQTITRTTDEANLFIRLGYQNIPMKILMMKR